MMYTVVGYTKSYGHRQKADTSFEITNETLRLFLGMVLPSGYHKLSNRKMYWETIPDTFAQAMSDSVPRNRAYSSKFPSLWQLATW